MCDQWMRLRKVSLDRDSFERLPRNSAYRYEYNAGEGWIHPQPRFYHARLDLTRARPVDPARSVEVAPLPADAWEGLPLLFASAFARVEPFAGLPGPDLLEAARGSLEQTRTGGDGPLIEQACRIARRSPTGEVLGAALVTLLPPEDPTTHAAYYWTEPPPPDAVRLRLGCPHLTWIFVTPEHTGQGVGTLLLGAVVTALRKLGYGEMLSTFLRGNDSSLLWHWRSGFELLMHPSSFRHPRWQGG